MNTLLKLSALTLLIGNTHFVSAGDMGVSSPDAWYLVGDAGYSNSNDANIRVNPLIWDPALQGYSNSLGSTAILSFGVGKYLTSAFHLDIRGEHRGDYKYHQLQTGVNNGTPGFTASTRTRQFEVDSNTLMVSGWYDLGYLNSNLIVNLNTISIQPYIGLGLGANYLNVHNFHTIGNPFGKQRNEIASINASNTHTELAWHAAAGLSAQLNSRTTFSIGYNYFDGGNLPFPNYILSSTSSPSASLGRNGVSVTPWKGKLIANEVIGEIRGLI